MNINPKPENLLDVLYLSFADFNTGTFTMAHAKAIEGNDVRVAVSDSGLKKVYTGIITAVNETLTLIGKEEIYNECIKAVRLTAFH